jgi:REP element-mobilizing transposase RayT
MTSSRRSEGASSRPVERGDFRIVHYSIQDDHLHLLVEAEGSDALGRGMKSVSSRIARAVQRVFEWTEGVLDGRYHVRWLRSVAEAWNALRYVLLIEAHIRPSATDYAIARYSNGLG